MLAVVFTGLAEDASFTESEVSSPKGPPPTVVRLSSDYVGPATLNGGAKASFYQVGFQAQIPFPIARELSGNVGLGIENRGYHFSQFGSFLPGFESPLNQAVAARIAPGLAYRLNDRWRLFAGGSWMYSGVLGSLVSEASLWGGAAGAFYQVTPNLTLVGGFGFTERFDAAKLYVPILGFNWRINEQWQLVGGDVANTINGPTLGAQVSYRLNDQWSLFGIGGYEGTFTRLDDSSSIPDGSLRYRSAAALLGFEYEFVPGLVVRVYGGARLAQQYTFRDQEGIDVADDTTGTSPSVGLVLRAAF